MGGEYAIDGYSRVDDAMEAEALADDEGRRGAVWCLLPEEMARTFNFTSIQNMSPNDRDSGGIAHLLNRIGNQEYLSVVEQHSSWIALQYPTMKRI